MAVKFGLLLVIMFAISVFAYPTPEENIEGAAVSKISRRAADPLPHNPYGGYGHGGYGGYGGHHMHGGHHYGHKWHGGYPQHGGHHWHHG